MEENKNLTPETEEEDFDIAEAVKNDKKAKKQKSPKKGAPKKIKNMVSFKKGSYSLAITAAVIIGAIILNVITSALSTRFVLEFDMTQEKNYSISEDNIEYIQSVEEDIEILVCASESDYTYYTGYWAENYHGVYDDNAESYYEQTVKLINKYGDYNNKINIRYVDPMTSDFSEVTSKYPKEAETIGYGDIIVSAGDGDNERYKVITYEDIYQLYEDTTYASYGYSFYTVAGNSLETALTSGIAYVLSGDTKSVAIYTGHSATDYSSEYVTLLEDNNYEVTVIDDSLISAIPDEYDAIALLSPTVDFGASELDAIAEYLDNDGKLGKGLLVFADASTPYLTELYDYLSQWGIVIEDGIVYETYDGNHMDGDNTTFATISTGMDDMLSSIDGCITGSNVPMYAGKTTSGITATELVTLPYDTGVIAPKGTSSDWSDADSDDGIAYAGAILSTKSTYDSDNNLISSNVAVFSSMNFVSHSFSNYDIDNETLSVLATNRVSGADDAGIVFNSKYIDPAEGQFTEAVAEESSKTMRNIFMWALPIITLAVSIVVYYRRKNAE